jgi:hypothetical protein
MYTWVMAHEHVRLIQIITSFFQYWRARRTCAHTVQVADVFIYDVDLVRYRARPCLHASFLTTPHVSSEFLSGSLHASPIAKAVLLCSERVDAVNSIHCIPYIDSAGP